MAHLIKFNTHKDDRGFLTVIDKDAPFNIKRVFYIYGSTKERGKHRHHLTKQALICLNGQSQIFVHNLNGKENFILNNPSECLVLEPHDWHTMKNQTKDTILLVLASENYNPDDYIYEAYD